MKIETGVIRFYLELTYFLDGLAYQVARNLNCFSDQNFNLKLPEKIAGSKNFIPENS